MGQYQEGQKLWCLFRRGYGLNNEVEITKVGRRWLILSNGHRVDINTLWLDGGVYASPGQCYLSQEVWRKGIMSMPIREESGRECTETRQATDVPATCGTEIRDGDRIEVILPSRSAYSNMTLARGTVYFKHGSYRIRKEDAHVSDTPRLDDFSYDCIINILEPKTED